MTYAFSNSGSAGNSASGTSLSVAATFAGGEHVYVRTTRSGATTETITDGTNTYTALGSTTNALSGDVQTVYECQSVHAGTFTILQSLGAAMSFRGIQWASYTGLNGASSVLGNFQNAPGGGTDQATSGTFTPSGQPALLLAWVYDFTTFGLSIAAGTGFGSIRDTFPDESGANGGSSAIADRRLTSTAATAATFTLGAGGADEVITFAIFCLESTGGGVSSDDDQVISS